MWLVIQLFSFFCFLWRRMYISSCFIFPLFFISLIFVTFERTCASFYASRSSLRLLFESVDPFMLAWDTIITLQRHYAGIFQLTWQLKGPKQASDWSPAAKPIQLKIKIGLSWSSKNFDLKILLGKAFPYWSRKFQVF